MAALERVESHLPAGIEDLRAEAAGEGYGMLERLLADWRSAEARFDQAGERLLAAVWNGNLAGIGGLTIDPCVQGAFRMRRFYIRPAYRRRGIGRDLALALLAGRDACCPVTVNAGADSVAFWESLGFQPVITAGITHAYQARSMRAAKQPRLAQCACR